MKFFERHGKELPVSRKAEDYQPGEIVCWRLEGGMYHIGIVLSEKSRDGERQLIIHNIGGGQVIEDCLFSFKIIGHYRYGG
jgi:uncharacterized protein YijF (DUF1287 family)